MTTQSLCCTKIFQRLVIPLPKSAWTPWCEMQSSIQPDAASNLPLWSIPLYFPIYPLFPIFGIPEDFLSLKRLIRTGFLSKYFSCICSISGTSIEKIRISEIYTLFHLSVPTLAKVLTVRRSLQITEIHSKWRNMWTILNYFGFNTKMGSKWVPRTDWQLDFLNSVFTSKVVSYQLFSWFSLLRLRKMFVESHCMPSFFF